MNVGNGPNGDSYLRMQVELKLLTTRDKILLACSRWTFRGILGLIALAILAAFEGPAHRIVFFSRYDGSKIYFAVDHWSLRPDIVREARPWVNGTFKAKDSDGLWRELSPTYTKGGIIPGN